MIGLVTDSNSQLPPELAARYGVEVVPLTVTVDGVAHLEGVDLDADGFYARFAGGRTPVVSTSQPSPGQFVDVYQRLADCRGHRDPLDPHRLGDQRHARTAPGWPAQGSAVPVRPRSTPAPPASAWRAACGRRGRPRPWGGTSRRRHRSPSSWRPPSATSSPCGRSTSPGPAVGWRPASTQGRVTPSPCSRSSAVRSPVVGTAATTGRGSRRHGRRVTAAGTEAAGGRRGGRRRRRALVSALEDRLRGHEHVLELVRYRVGPSVGVHSGPGTAGAFFYPAG
jgi:hypothetical protein